MIPSIEIREKARENSIPLTTIERDYTQNWILKYLFPLNMALKGGTGIKKAYIGDYRFSDDLDFTLLEKRDEHELLNLIKKSIINAKEESGINFHDNIEIEENINGFELDVYFRILRESGSHIKIKLDITKFQEEKIFLPLQTRDILHLYSDKIDATVKVYALEEIYAEKIRALFERTRPRDLYDVCFLYERVDKEKVLHILQKKCDLKGVRIDIQSLINRKDDFANAWESSLKNQLKKLPDFEKAFDTVMEIVG